LVWTVLTVLNQHKSLQVSAAKQFSGFKKELTKSMSLFGRYLNGKYSASSDMKKRYI